MAALSSFLLLHRASSTSVRLLSALFLPFSTSSLNDHITRYESVLEKSVPHPWYRDQPHLPIPDGFPFSIKDYRYGITLVRVDKDEDTHIDILLRSYQMINGNPSIVMSTDIVRGYWNMSLEVIAGPKTMSIREAVIREELNHYLKFLKSFSTRKGSMLER